MFLVRGDGAGVDDDRLAPGLFEVGEIGIELFVSDNLDDGGRQTSIDQVPQALEGTFRLEEVRHHDGQTGTAGRGSVVEERLVQRRAAAGRRRPQRVEYFENLRASAGWRHVAANRFVERGHTRRIAAGHRDVTERG